MTVDFVTAIIAIALASVASFACGVAVTLILLSIVEQGHERCHERNRQS